MLSLVNNFLSASLYYLVKPCHTAWSAPSAEADGVGRQKRAKAMPLETSDRLHHGGCVFFVGNVYRSQQPTKRYYSYIINVGRGRILALRRCRCVVTMCVYKAPANFTIPNLPTEFPFGIWYENTGKIPKGSYHTENTDSGCNSKINLYLLYLYIWALVQLWIRSCNEESFPPILCMPWLGGNAIYGALSALYKT